MRSVFSFFMNNCTQTRFKKYINNYLEYIELLNLFLISRLQTDIKIVSSVIPNMPENKQGVVAGQSSYKLGM